MLVPVGNIDKMADAIRSILSAPEKASAMGSEATKITKKLAPDKVYGKWKIFIETVIN